MRVSTHRAGIHLLTALALVAAHGSTLASEQVVAPACAEQVAPVYYVAPGGNDANPGTLAAPWKTVQKAANTAVAGSTVYVRGGTYNEAVRVGVSGSAAAGYTTFRNYEGEVPILDGTGLAVPRSVTAMFLIVDKSYIVVQGFEIRNFKTSKANRVPAGIRVQGASHHVQILGNHVHHIENNNTRSGGNAFGIAVYGTSATSSINNLTIDGNEVDHLKTGSSESLVVNGNVDGFAITHNLIHDNNNIGIDVIGFEGTCPTVSLDQARNGIVADNTVYNITSRGNPAYGHDQSADGIYVDGGASTVIERNTIHNVDIGLELASEHSGRSTSNCTARDNFIYNCNVVGVSIGGYDTRRGSTRNCVIVNNTLYDNDTTRSGTGEINLQYQCVDNVIANNIVYANDQGLLVSNAYTSNSSNLVDYNIYYAAAGSGSAWQWKKQTYTGFSAYKQATGNDTHGQFANPQLVNLSTPDLHLVSTSPAINAGVYRTDLGAYDVDTQTRIQGGTVDVGADEVGGQ